MLSNFNTITINTYFTKKLIKSNHITIDSKSGYWCRKKFRKKFTHKNLFKSTFAYGIKNHRHICETEEQLLKYTNKKINFTFNPHLLPLSEEFYPLFMLLVKR